MRLGPQRDFVAALRELFYDTAGASGDNSLSSLFTIVDSSRVLFGSDYPFMPEAAVEQTVRDLNSSQLVSVTALREIEHANATKLFRRNS